MDVAMVEKAGSDASQQQLLNSYDRDDAGIVYVRERPSKWTRFASHFTCFGLGVIATALIFGVATQSRQMVQKQTFAFAKTDALPSVPSEQIVFESDPVYSARSSDDSDYAWNLLMPPGRGYVFVDDPHDRGLADGEMTPFGPIYSVAMFHQLHCLARIRGFYWTFLDAVTTGEDGMARTFAGRTSMAHAQHCFDYLRQSIQCQGDMTLEWPKQDGPSSGAVVDGWGVPHTCKSRTAIKDYMDRYHYNESLSFDAAG